MGITTGGGVFEVFRVIGRSAEKGKGASQLDRAFFFSGGYLVYTGHDLVYYATITR